MTQTTDVIIIGGGIHGASLAFHLTRRGVKVIVLERNTLASGATSRSSGLVRMHYDLEPESRLAWESFQYFRNWKEIVGGDSGFTRTGFLQIVEPKLVDHLKANVIMHQRIGIPSMLIGAEDVKRLAPYFYTDDFEVAAYEPESGYADPYGACRSLIDSARERGARLIQGCAVSGIKINAGRAIGVTTAEGDFDAPVIVNAAGAFAAQVAAMAGIDLPITTWRHDTMFIRRPKEIGPSHPTVIDEANMMYFRPEGSTLTLVGLEDNNPLGLPADGDADHALAGFVERAAERICKRIPIMDNGSLQSAHGGYDGLTPDQRAILGGTEIAGFYLDCGFSGTGFKIAPAVGACMSELIVDGAARTVDISPFHYKRFAENKLLKGEHEYGNIWQ
jgi:sarcosine oxidase subunit beta